MSEVAKDSLACVFHEIGKRKFLLEVRGALGKELDPRLFDAVSEIRGLSGNAIALDLSGGEALDGEGLLCLFRLGFAAKQKNLSLAAFGTGPRSQDILARLGLGKVIPLFSTRNNALRALGAEALETSSPDESGREICAEGEWLSGFGPVAREELPPGDPGLNVAGRMMQGPAEGFGPLVLKRYSLRLCKKGLTVAEAASALRSKLGELWPEGNTIRFRESGVAPGAVGTIRLTMPGGAPLATGVRVVHAGASSFTFAPIRGHMASGFINFAVFEDKDCPVIRIGSLARTGDPVFDVGFRLFGHKQQEQFWKETLARAAKAFGVPAEVTVTKDVVDESTNSAGWSNVFGNAAILTPFGLLFASLSSLSGKGKSS